MINILKKIVSDLYNIFLANRSRGVRLLLPSILVLSLIIGAGYRSIVLKENFEIWNGFGVFLSLASNFQKTQGAYSFDEYLDINKNPDEYVYTKGKSKFEPTGSIENELGWSFILSLILREGVQGVHNLALIIARYQIMIDLSIIIILFWVGKRIAGSVGACLAPLFYSIFKMPMVVMSWISYYYWTIPLSALSLLFWVVLYKPEDNITKKYLYFFLYGAFIGFATFVRLYFLLLPLFMSPLIFVREKAFKKGLVLLLIMLLGQSVLLIPQVLLTKKHHGVYALTTRGSWHLVVQGLGIYPNPWGIKDSGDVTVSQWAIDRGGPDLNKDGMNAYNEFLRKEVFKMVKERPEIFLRNFLNNMQGGMTISTHFFQFFGIIDTVPSMDKLFKVFPWLILSAFIFLSIFSRDKFWVAAPVFLQGLYLLLVVCSFFPPYIPFVAGYIPVFSLLLSIAIAVHVKVFIAFGEACIRCWLNNEGIGSLPKLMVECYKEDWSLKHNAEQAVEDIHLSKQLMMQEKDFDFTVACRQIRMKVSSKWICIVSVILLFTVIGVWFRSRIDNFNRIKLREKAYAVWMMDMDDTVERVWDSKLRNHAQSFNTGIVKGLWGNARTFNGKNSYIQTSVSFQGWKGITISLWVKPEHKDGNELSVILDNGHDAYSNFVVQTADINNSDSEKWVLHFNGKDILLTIPFEQWTHLVITADTESRTVKAYTNGKEVGIIVTDGFEFGDVPLTVGKLAKDNSRYFKGAIEEIVIIKKAINT